MWQQQQQKNNHHEGLSLTFREKMLYQKEKEKKETNCVKIKCEKNRNTIIV